MDQITYAPGLETIGEWARRNASLRYHVFYLICGGEPHCQCPGCGVTFLAFLQMDHKNGNGAAHRKEHGLGTGAARLWRYVRDHKEEWADFQILCANCNKAKFNKAACPLAGKPHCGCGTILLEGHIG